MKVKEFDGEFEVVTYSDYDECVRLQDEYDPGTGDETGNYNVSIDFSGMVKFKYV